jgi:nicotinate phosphoribosyltransferase
MLKYHIDILDTDLYKLTMQNAICTLYPKVLAEYTFKNRDNREFPDGFGKRLREIVDDFRRHTLNKDGFDFLKEKCYYLNPVYLDYLKGYRYDPNEVLIEQEGSKLLVKVIGLWARTVLWEVPLMATISELYFEMTGQKGEEDRTKRCGKVVKKATEFDMNKIYYSEFGTRRRYSFENQREVIADLKDYGSTLVGTSNVFLAMAYNLMPSGTVAHEWYQFHGARYGYKAANEMANEAWIQVYQGDLGTALTDTYTSDIFFESFSTKYAKLFDGIRQDSGNPITFIDKAVDHYKRLRINPMYKYAMFSDNLKSMDQIISIHNACKDKIIDRYGIGTWLSNDVNVKPLNIVIKLTGVSFDSTWNSAVKLSDDINKNNGNDKEVELCKRTLGITA